MGKCTQGKRPTANGQPFLFSFDSNFEQEAVPLWYLLPLFLCHGCCHLAAWLQLVITCMHGRHG